MNNFVSIIIPAYNSQKYIKKTIESVLSQTYENFEILIIDDASSDETVHEIKKMGDQRIRIICNENNMGACASRNRGVSEAKGDYIAFQDSDDIWHVDKLEICMRTLEEKQCDVVFSSYVLNDKMIEPRFNLNNSENKFLDHMKHFCIGTPTIVAKRKVFIEEKFDTNLPRLQDYEVMLRVLQRFNVYYIDRPLVYRYLQMDGITANHQKGIDAFNYIFMKYAQVIENNKSIQARLYDVLGKCYENKGESGYSSFVSAYQAEPSTSRYIICIVSRLRIYRIMHAIVSKIKGTDIL